MRSSFPLLLITLALATPASGHLLHRGVPLSELSASSPVAVIGRVLGQEQETVKLAVEKALLGEAPKGTLEFSADGHHPPRYSAGTEVVVFLDTRQAPWTSRQTKLDKLELPAAGAEREALLAAIQGYAGLRAVGDTAGRLAALKELSLDLLESESERLRNESLMDLIAIAPRTPFEAAEIEGLTRLASSRKTPEAQTPGLVLLLTAIRGDAADRALFAVLASEGHPRARARAATVIGNRHGASAADTLRGLLGDPAEVVRATARHALAKLESKNPSQRVALEANVSKPREGTHDAVHPTDPN